VSLSPLRTPPTSVCRTYPSGFPPAGSHVVSDGTVGIHPSKPVSNEVDMGVTIGADNAMFENNIRLQTHK